MQGGTFVGELSLVRVKGLVEMALFVPSWDHYLPGYDWQEPVQVDVAHLLSVLHLPDDLLQLALAGAVAQAPHNCPDLPDINLKMFAFQLEHS